MNECKGHYKAHVFVCTHQKKNGQCCALSGGEELRRELKEWTKQNPEWRKRIRINNSGCLDQCQNGIAIAIYPQNKWLLNLRPHNLEEVKKYITQLMEDESERTSPQTVNTADNAIECSTESWE